MNPYGSDGGVEDSARRPFQTRHQASRTSGRQPPQSQQPGGSGRHSWGQLQPAPQQHSFGPSSSAAYVVERDSFSQTSQQDDTAAFRGGGSHHQIPPYQGASSSGQYGASTSPAHENFGQRATSSEHRPFAAQTAAGSRAAAPQNRSMKEVLHGNFSAALQRLYDKGQGSSGPPSSAQPSPPPTRQYARDLPPPAVVTQPSLGARQTGSNNFAEAMQQQQSALTRHPAQHSYPQHYPPPSTSHAHPIQTFDPRRDVAISQPDVRVQTAGMHHSQPPFATPPPSLAHHGAAPAYGASAPVAQSRPVHSQPKMREQQKLQEFEFEIKKVNWIALYGKRPSFNMYDQFLERKQSMDWALLCGKTPQFQDFVAFQHELESKDWIALCKLIPTFTDYVEYLHKIETLSDQDKCDVAPTFRDYIDYFVNGDNGKKWSASGDASVNFANYLRFSKVRDTNNWREISPNLGEPLFTDYLRYTACVSAIDFKAMQCEVPGFTVYMEFLEQASRSDYERLTGVVPTFHKYMEFKLHEKSRDWVQFCGSSPTFKDYVYYLGHSTSRNWKKLEEHNDKPYFTDYMKFQQICETKKLGGVGQFSPTFEHFIEYLIFRASKDWKTMIGRTPTFIDFVEYIECTKTREWISLGDRMPTFEEFMIERCFREQRGQATGSG